MTIRTDFSDPYPVEQEKFGIITGTYLVSRLPNIPGRMFRLKARSANGGSIFLGDAETTGSSPRMPWEMEASYDTGWFSSDNLNRYYQAGSSGSCYLGYWVQG